MASRLIVTTASVFKVNENSALASAISSDNSAENVTVSPAIKTALFAVAEILSIVGATSIWVTFTVKPKESVSPPLSVAVIVRLYSDCSE